MARFACSLNAWPSYGEEVCLGGARSTIPNSRLVQRLRPLARVIKHAALSFCPIPQHGNNVLRPWGIWHCTQKKNVVFFFLPFISNKRVCFH